MQGKTVLFDYWRSSASYRVRIALYLADIAFETVAVDLSAEDHTAPAHLARNPQGFVPVLDIDGQRFTQSLGIIDYLDTIRQLGLWPLDPVHRAQVNGVVGSIAIDTHPVCNLSVANYASGDDPTRRSEWMQHFITKGLCATEALLQGFPETIYSADDQPGIIDICLIPQLYNAHRWQVDYRHLNRIVAISEACRDHPAFVRARPSKPEA
ncbi:maleylacetoacetate isomerase [uncultured Roseovarius sp.]|uniref:maleylacetoacetate isomerase n=1 Tax=uncultured Roseovarius sp. TaxID=293344 RepID=UPI00260F6F9B|nr:maleylacetoacetate isomerase [uncultured Roseovarius sp.]